MGLNSNSIDIIMKYLLGTLIGFALSTTTAFAQEAASIDTGDIAWMLIATALVMLMTPAGLALFYGGLIQNKHVLNTIGMASGAISGLVGITPASGFVDASGALAIGIISGLVGYWGVVHLKSMMNHDDTLDAFGIHGLVGIAGALLTGIFANPDVNGGSGLLYGNPNQLWVQGKAVIITILFSGITTAIVWKVSELITRGGRIREELELEGMDIGYHGEHHMVVGEEKIIN